MKAMFVSPIYGDWCGQGRYDAEMTEIKNGIGGTNGIQHSMTTMRERMARAMADKIGGHHSSFYDHTDACLDALMEPTEGMVREYLGVCTPPKYPYYKMIRAAKEGK